MLPVSDQARPRLPARRAHQDPAARATTRSSIGIAMSFLDVHVNRAPIAGRVTSAPALSRAASARCGKPEMVFENERATTVIEGDGLQVAVVQIASRLVRQIAVLRQGGRGGRARPADRRHPARLAGRRRSFPPATTCGSRQAGRSAQGRRVDHRPSSPLRRRRSADWSEDPLGGVPQGRIRRGLPVHAAWFAESSRCRPGAVGARAVAIRVEREAAQRARDVVRDGARLATVVEAAAVVGEHVVGDRIPGARGAVPLEALDPEHPRQDRGTCCCGSSCCWCCSHRSPVRRPRRGRGSSPRGCSRRGSATCRRHGCRWCRKRPWRRSSSRSRP